MFSSHVTSRVPMLTWVWTDKALDKSQTRPMAFSFCWGDLLTRAHHLTNGLPYTDRPRSTGVTSSWRARHGMASALGSGQALHLPSPSPGGVEKSEVGSTICAVEDARTGTPASPVSLSEACPMGRFAGTRTASPSLVCLILWRLVYPLAPAWLPCREDPAGLVRGPKSNKATPRFTREASTSNMPHPSCCRGPADDIPGWLPALSVPPLRPFATRNIVDTRGRFSVSGYYPPGLVCDGSTTGCLLATHWSGGRGVWGRLQTCSSAEGGCWLPMSSPAPLFVDFWRFLLFT
jgi:hypothetical protein